jgi:HD domain
MATEQLERVRAASARARAVAKRTAVPRARTPSGVLSASWQSMRAVVHRVQLAARRGRTRAERSCVVASTPAVMDAQVTAEDARRAVDFFHLCEQLKVRQGAGGACVARFASAACPAWAPWRVRSLRAVWNFGCAATVAVVTRSAGPPSLLQALTPWRERFAQRTKRTGWLRFGIEGTESIADHMYRMVSSAAWRCRRRSSHAPRVTVRDGVCVRLHARL